MTTDLSTTREDLIEHSDGGQNRTSNPRVFVVHEPLKKQYDPATGKSEFVRIRDLRPAMTFGDLTYVFPPGHITPDPAFLMSTARERLSDFTGRDFLLLMGDTAAIAVSAIVAAQTLPEGDDVLQILIWDNKKGVYYRQAIEVWTPDDAEDEEVELSPLTV